MTDRPPSNPNAGVIGCQVTIDGATVSDGGPGTSPLDPAVLSGLSIRWGRTTTVDQPPPASCSFTLLDLPGDRAFMEAVKVGARVDVSASAMIYPDDPTESVYDDDGSSMRSAKAVLSAGAGPDDGRPAWRVRPNPGAGASYTVAIPPAPPAAEGTDPAAWDGIPTTSVGQTWRVTVAVWAPPGARVFLSPTVYAGPWRSASRPAPNIVGPVPSVTGGPAGQWQELTGAFNPDTAGEWVGMRIAVQPAGLTWDTVAGTWDDQPEWWTWDYLGDLWLSGMAIAAPAAGTVRNVAVYSGRITDAEARYDRRVGGSVVDVTAQDFTADLANVYVGSTPWPTETAGARMTRILSAAAPAVQLLADPRPAGLLVAARDVDRQAAAGLLERIAQSVDAVLRAAVHPTTGPYLRLEDPAGRPALASLVLTPGGVVVIEPADPAGLRPMRPDLVDLDPVRWRQSVADVISRVTVDWQDQTGPDPVQRTETRTNPDLIAEVGERSASLSSELTTASDARLVADQLLARLDDTTWRMSGLVVDTRTLDLDADAVDLVVTLLDGTARIGLALSIPAIPEWTPSPVHNAGVYVEGGSYSYIDGCWSLELDATTPNGLGRSVTWDEIPAGWTWDQFDPEITWDALTGVGV